MVLWLDDGRMDAGIESHGYGGSAAAAGIGRVEGLESHGYGGSAAAANDDDRSLSVNA